MDPRAPCRLYAMASIRDTSIEKATKFKRTVQTAYKTATVNGIFKMEMYACM